MLPYNSHTLQISCTDDSVPIIMHPGESSNMQAMMEMNLACESRHRQHQMNSIPKASFPGSAAACSEQVMNSWNSLKHEARYMTDGNKVPLKHTLRTSHIDYDRNEKCSEGNHSSTKGSGLRPGRRCKVKEDKLCGVCGDKALSCNFDAISCESCKAFFRRNACKGVNGFKCLYSDNCVITISSRRLCKKCRIRKCFDIGMKKEYIMTNDERQEKKVKIKQNKILKMLEDRGWIAKDLSSAEIAEKELLNETEIGLIDEVVEAYHSSLWIKSRAHPPGCQNPPSMADLINTAEISIRRAIEMFKRISAFRQLEKSDQALLLRSACVELLVLRGVLCYDPQKEHFLDSGDNELSDSLSLSDFMVAAGPEVSMAFQRLTNTLLNRLQCCQKTMLLLLVVCLFSERYTGQKSYDSSSAMSTSSETDQDTNGSGGDGMNATSSAQSPSRISQLQTLYSGLLKRFLTTKLTSRQANRLFPQVMLSLSELRTINEHLNQRIININLNFVAPLMLEMLNIPLSGNNSSAPSLSKAPLYRTGSFSSQVNGCSTTVSDPDQINDDSSSYYADTDDQTI